MHQRFLRKVPITADGWLPVPGFEKYYDINIDGRVRSKQKKNVGRILTQRRDSGYISVKLNRDCAYTTQYIHRLIALAFIDNPHSKPVVNHKNGIKTDNRIENLEWVTHQENSQHAYLLGLVKVAEKKAVIDKCSGQRYVSIKAAALANGIPYETCKHYLSGRKSNPTCLQIAA